MALFRASDISRERIFVASARALGWHFTSSRRVSAATTLLRHIIPHVHVRVKNFDMSVTTVFLKDTDSLYVLISVDVRGE
jgi:hypothetical protein